MATTGEGFSEKMVTLEQEQYLISSCKELNFYRDKAYETGKSLGRQTVLAKGRKQYLRKSCVMGSIIMAYQRNSSDYDGVFRQYIYLKANGTSAGGWLLAWSIIFNIPSDICQAFSLNGGAAPCGFNSYCTLGDHQEPIYNCVPGYAYLDPDNKIKGCKQNFAPQTCDEGLEQV
ncbi:g-type lectin s-receptor-like serine/threonine-protein kinase lecrk1 [Quercus suber]|uniref:G-type lectin s-receptor-like serine/threonine-protein kinase lecrk1 n=1 Tax=Quercus suber TaxID=58331 RepID=A0AAW0M709_QUESU